MEIKFDFSLDRFDEETLFSALQDQIVNCHERILELMEKGKTKEDTTDNR